MSEIRQHLSFANVASGIALFVALSTGGAIAANLIGTDDIERNAIISKLIGNNQVKTKDIKDNKGVRGIDVADGSLTSADLLDGTIATADFAAGSVDAAAVADGSLSAADLVSQERFHVLGAPGEPAFSNGGQGDCVWGSLTVALPTLNQPGFKIDRFGVVDLSGGVFPTEVAGAGDAECGATLPEPDDAAEDTRIFTLPPAYRPAKTEVFYAPSQAVPNQAVIVVGTETFVGGTTTLPPGTVAANTPDSALFLDGVSFPAASAGVVSSKKSASPASTSGRRLDLPGLLGG